MSRVALLCCVLTAGLGASATLVGGSIDLTNATIAVLSSASRAPVYAQMLQREVAARSGLRWPVGNQSSAGRPCVELRVAPNRSTLEGYALYVVGRTVRVEGHSERGLLFGVGRLIRELNLTLTENYYTARVGSASLPAGLAIRSYPDRPMRGVQIGYRPKTNSYDGLTPALFEKFVVELALFGINQVELIPHSFDDAPYSPHFGLSHKEMNIEMSRILDKYGLNVSLWFPACDPSRSSFHGCTKGNYSDPAVMAAAVADWDDVFSSMPRVDTLFINAGDPGQQAPADLVRLTERASRILRSRHPGASTWICPQDWLPADFSTWVSLSQLPSTRAWLDGVIYGPGMPDSLPNFARVSGGYPIRLYPDMTHSLSDQIPVPNWDPVFHWAENREVVNPRPSQHGRIASSQKQFGSAGFGAYNEGCHDDVNKLVWSAVFWGCDSGSKSSCDEQQVVHSWLTQWARVHFGSALEELVTEAVYSLERNWVGPIVGNAQINSTLALFRRIETTMSPRVRWAWRLQQLFYRANFDRFLQIRATVQRSAETKALGLIKSTKAPQKAMAQAEEVLTAADIASETSTALLWTEMRVWAEAVFQSVHEQFSVPIYGGEYTRRGNNLDTAKLPLSNAPYLRRTFAGLKNVSTDKQRDALDAIVRWQDPGLGGWYDSLGELDASPHYVHDVQNETGDQAVHPAPVVSAEDPSEQYYQLNPEQSLSSSPPTLSPPKLPDDKPRSQLTYVKTTSPLPVSLKYPHLSKGGLYSLAFNGGADGDYTVTANGHEVLKTRGNKRRDDVLALPSSITVQGGELVLQWSGPEGVELKEVWLMKRK